MVINIDSHQVFPDLDTNKIDDTICKSDNPKTGLFLLENKHLINKFYLSSNTNNWVVNFLINNPEYKYSNIYKYKIKPIKASDFISFVEVSSGFKYSN